jgi:hypothetical protein
VSVLQLAVQLLECGAHLRGGPNRPEGVVLPQLGDAEDGHDSIPDVLLHGAPVAFQHRAHAVEVGGHDPAENFGVETFTEGGRPDHVGEHDGHRLALHGRRLPEAGSGQRIGAIPFASCACALP